MKLTMKQLEKLNSYIGCGPHKDADILVMGNEEGTGGYPTQIEAHVTARFRLYGKNEETVDKLIQAMKTDSHVLHDDELHQEEYYTYSLNGDWRSGFWEENDKNGENKIERYIIARDGRLEKKVEVPPSQFLFYLARISLALDNRNENKPLDNWFQKVGVHPDIDALVMDYVKHSLFKTSGAVEGVKTALTDWRPLPRPNQDSWFEEYGLLGDSDKSYENAYFFKRSEKGTVPYKLAERRASLFKDLLTESNARFLIMIGEVENKIGLIKRFFPEQEVRSTRLPMRCKAFSTTVQLPQKTMHIYTLPFFGNGALSLNELYEFVRDVLLPDYSGQPRLQRAEAIRNIHPREVKVKYMQPKAAEQITDPNRQQQLHLYLRELISLQQPQLIEDVSTATMIRFSTQVFDRKIPYISKWTKSGRLLMFEFKTNKNRISLELHIGPNHPVNGTPAIREQLVDYIYANRSDQMEISELANGYTRLLSRTWIKTREYNSLSVEALKNKIHEHLEEFINRDLPIIHEMIRNANVE